MSALPPVGITGIHHLTAVSSDAQRAVDFYTRILGLRLVKQTVDARNPSSFHLYFADEEHGPGILTVLERKGSPRGAWGIGGTHHLAFETESRDTLRQWKRWLTDNAIPVTGPYDRVYFESIYFTDPDGLIVEIATRGPGWTVDETADALGRAVMMPPPETMAGGRDEAAIRVETWPEPIPAPTPPMRLRGMHHITAIGSDANEIERFFTGALGLRLLKRTVNFDDPSAPHLYFGVGDGEPGTVVTYFAYPHGTVRDARPGIGLTDHYALSVRDDETLAAWRDHLIAIGVATSGIEDHVYYRAIALRDPDGHIVEIATNGPGFTVDEAPDELGRRLRLPPWLEADRREIERRLTTLAIPDPVGR